MPEEHSLPVTRGRVFYADTQVDVLRRVLAWLESHERVSLHIIKLQVSDEGEETAIAFYEEMAL